MFEIIFELILFVKMVTFFPKFEFFKANILKLDLNTSAIIYNY